jgi:hypothetical protein
MGQVSSERLPTIVTAERGKKEEGPKLEGEAPDHDDAPPSDVRRATTVTGEELRVVPREIYPVRWEWTVRSPRASLQPANGRGGLRRHRSSPSGPDGSSGVISISGGSGFGTPGTSWSLTDTDAGIFTPAAQHPSVCIYDGNSGANYKDTGVAVMEFNDGSLWSFDGPIGTNVSTGNPCEWSATAVQQYDHGSYPRVSCQNGTLSNRGGVQGVEVHQGTNSTSDTPLWSHTFTDTSF